MPFETVEIRTGPNVPFEIAQHGGETMSEN
jgi:hypothetical protein